MTRDPRSTFSDPPLSAGLSYGILSALDSEQRKAAEILTGQVLLLAGPGSGKTRTLTHRIAHLVTSKTARPEQCLVLLFSRRACAEMDERLKKLLGKKAGSIQIQTFQSFGLQVLTEQRQAAGLPLGFRLADRKERIEFAVKALHWTEARIGTALRQLALVKTQGAVVIPRSDEAVLDILFREWREHEGWLDEEDLLSLPLQIFDKSQEVAASYRARFRFISVDESQDLNALGYRMVCHLVRPDGNLCVSCDPDQSIDRSHGAEGCFLSQFETNFPFMHKVRLTRNYRSGDAILTAAAKIIAPIHLATEPIMTPFAGDRGRVEIYGVGNDRAEAEYVVQTIEKLIGGTADVSDDNGQSSEVKENEYTFSDIGVIYRTEEQAALLKEALERSGFPFRCFSPESFGTECDEGEESISLLPLAAAKGFEFRVVFMTECEDGRIPLKGAGSMSNTDLEAERRLFYVGMTRAKACLFLTHASKRLQSGRLLDRNISPFLKTIERNLIHPKQTAMPSPRKMIPKSQLDLFR